MRSITIPPFPLHPANPAPKGSTPAAKSPLRLVVHFPHHTFPPRLLVYQDTRIVHLLLPLEDVPRHLQEPLLSLALGELGDGCGRLVGVVLGQRARLLDAVGLEDQLAGL